jgi:phosphate starvation-inducible PhoH-like protein
VAGILGLGRIGKAIAQRLEAHGMKIAYHGRKPQNVPWSYFDDLKALAAESDFLIVACPGGPGTQKLVNADVLASLGSEGTLINIARGSVVDETALITALENGTIRTAGLDVFEDEPRVPAGLMKCERAVLLPHVGSATHETRRQPALHAARGQGLAIRTPDFIRILETFARGEGADLKALYAAPLVIATNRKTIVPKTLGQKLYLQSILKNPVVFGIGPAGTGKTYLAMAAAVSALLKNEVQRIILTRPAVEAGEALGFLPGDLEEKILPYLRPLYDALHDMLDAAEITRLTEKGVIEIAPLAYMRGRTLSNAFIVLDEAQNTTPEQMMMFLTRLGEESRMVVTGDITQIDLPRSKQSGLLEVRRILQNIPGIDFHTFSGSDVVRHPLVLKIIEAYESYRNPIGSEDSPVAPR